MKPTKRLLAILSLALVLCLTVFFTIHRADREQEPSVKTAVSRDTDARKHVRLAAGRASGQTDFLSGQRGEDSPSKEPRDRVSGQLFPSQVEGKVLPGVDLDALAFRLTEEEFAVYERMRVEFPHVDWTEVDPINQAFIDKRSLLPLNLNDEQRETYAAWLGEVEPVSRALIRLRAEAQGLAARGMEDGRGYYIEGFREGAPVYTYGSNAGAATTTGASYIRSNPNFDPPLGATINGGEFYATICDLGDVHEHTEFQLPNSGGSRIILKSGTPVEDHSTHVAGTVAAWGYNSSLQGMAPRAWIRSLTQQYTSYITSYAMATPGQLMTVTNPRTGQLQMRSVVGNTSLSNNVKETPYTSTNATYDSLMRDYPYYVHCFAAHNYGANGWETLGTHWQVSKNVWTIGNVSAITRNADGNYVSGGTISSTSSRGPTYDGRIKPDFVAKGTSVLSTTGTSGSGTYSGTSMASPGVAGSVALLMDYVRQRLPQQYLRATTYKALLMNTADDLGNPGPDYTHGWGAVNVYAAAKIIRQQAENPSQRLILEDSLASGQTWVESYYSDGTKPIRVSVVWLDPAGAANVTGDRSPRLINDLDLRLIGPTGTEIKPYVMPFATGQGTTPAFDSSLYAANAVTGDNLTDPVEHVYIAAPAAGAYTVRVTHKRTLKDSQAQPFSVAVSGLITASGVAPTADVVFTETVTQNGLLSPGEEAVAAVSLVNYSRDAVNNVVGTLTTSDPNVTLLANTVSYGTLTTGQMSGGNGSFRIRLAAGASPRIVNLTLTVTSSSPGGPWVHPVTCTYVNDAAVNGHVRDGLGNPVAGATVSWTGTRAGQTTSDANGFYVIAEVDGSYNLTASKPGYVSRAPVSLTVPPYVTRDLFLDYCDLAIAPTAMSIQASSGQSASTPLTLTNNGSLPVTWSIPTSGYRFVTSDQTGGPAYVWNDISATGTLVTGLGDDTNLGPFALGFTMPFYGQNFSSIRVCSNGWLSFTSTTTGFTTSTLPDSARPENLIAPFMRDLDLRTEGTVHYKQVDGSTFVIQFTNAPRYSPNSTKKATFQVVLKRDGTILFYYQRTDDPTIGLVGIQNAAKNTGLTLAHNQAFLKPGLAVRIQTKPAWLGMTPTSGTIAVGAAATVSVTGNSTGLDAGNYLSNVFVESNDVGNPVQTALVSFNVVSNQPTITAWPTASAIVYGQPLSSSTLSGGNASVPGSFAFNEPSALLAAGTQNAAVTFTPEDTANYSPVTGSVTVTVAKATPAVTAWPAASAIDYGQAVSASNLTGGAASTAGSFGFLNSSATPPVGNHTAEVRFTPTDTANYQTVDGTVTVVVQQPTPTITTWPTASGIVYGQALSASTLSGGTASVPGAFAFDAPATTPDAGTYSAAVTFTPTDTANYSSVSGSVAVEVDKATPVVTSWPTASAINYGEYFSASSLSGGSANVPGIFIFDENGTGFTDSDSFTFKVSDGAVDSATATVSLTMATSGAPSQASAEPASSAPVMTNFSFESPVLANGAYNYVPTGAGWTFSSSAGIAANNSPWFAVAAPNGTQACFLQNSGTSISQSVNFPTAGSYTIKFSAIGRSGIYGSMPTNVRVNGSNVLSLTAAQIGTTAWTSFTSNPFIVSAGNHTIAFVNGSLYGDHATVIDHVQIVSLNGPPIANAQSVTVQPGTPTAITLTGSDPDNDPLTFEIVTQPTFGTLSGTPPNLTYSPPAVPAPGIHDVVVRFVPTDADNYHAISDSVELEVRAGNGVMVTTWPTASEITYGEALSASVLTGGSASVPGTFAFTDPATVPNAGTFSAAVTFTPNDTTNYSPTSGSVNVIVAKATPTVSAWPTASGITYGQALSASTLTGGAATVPGTFAFSAPATTPNTGTYSAAVTFTPTNPANYNTVGGSVNVSVAKATPTITAWPAASGITYGQTLSASTLTGGAATVPGTFAFTTPATTPNAGTYSAAVTFIPTSTANYNTVGGSVSVIVAKVTPTITAWPTASGITYGQALSSSTLTGGTASVPGTFAFTAPTTTPNAGTYSAAVTFTPTSTTNYNTVGGSVSVIVAKATPSITAWPTASDIEYGQYFSASSLIGGTASVPGSFAITDSVVLFEGQDSFTFRVSDSEFTSDPSTVSITFGQPAGQPAGEPQAIAEPNALRSWTPADITTRAWYDASDAVTIIQSSGSVSQWKDKSGNNRHVSQGTSTQRPTVSGSTISFDGTNDLLVHGSAFNYVAGSTDMYVVAAVANTGGRLIACENKTNNKYAQYGIAQTHSSDGSKMGTNIQSDDNTSLLNAAISTSGAFSRSAANFYQWRDTGSSVTGQVAGGSATTVNYTRGKPLTLNQFTIGAMGSRPSSSSGSLFVNAGINEVVITSNLSDADRQKMEGYLAWKWNLQAKLPADHPYKQAAPVVLANMAPVAEAQSVTAQPGMLTPITLTGSDPNNDPLTFEIVTQPSHGSITGSAPNITYAPSTLPAVGTHDVAVTFAPTDTANYHSVTGTVSVTVIAASSPYQTWITQYGDQGLSDPNGDNDNDGLNNFQEYAFGLNPTSASHGAVAHADGVLTERGTPAVSVTHIPDGVDFHAVFCRRKDYLDAGLIYQVQFSADLSTWVTSMDTPTVVAGDTEVEAVTVPYPAAIPTERGDEPPKFFRVGVVIP